MNQAVYYGLMGSVVTSSWGHGMSVCMQVLLCGNSCEPPRRACLNLRANHRPMSIYAFEMYRCHAFASPFAFMMRGYESGSGLRR